MVSDNHEGPARPTPSRRSLLVGAGLGAGAATVSTTALSVGAPAAAAAAGPTRARLATTASGGVRRATVPLALAGRGAPRSTTVTADRFALVALTWATGSPALSLRVRGLDGTWQGWQAVGHLQDGPSPDSEEGRAARRTRASDLVWVGDADAVEVAADGPVTGLAVELLDADAQAVPARRAERTAPMSFVYSRADWGADESLRDGSLRYCDRLEQVHVHHTAGANAYGAEDVPRIIRAMYAYHTQTLGWSDIGYNLLVDKFGRAFEGRAGGVKRLVRGAHTLGFNATSCGIALIGNHEGARPSAAAITQLTSLAAYKLDQAGLSPLDKRDVVSEGSDKYPSGTTAYLHVMDGHRDTNDTACPGRYVYASMDAIRRQTQDRIDAARVQDTRTYVRLDAPTTLRGGVNRVRFAVSNTDGTPAAGRVRVAVDGVRVQDATLVDGYGTLGLTVKPGVGTHTVQVTYFGTATSRPSSGRAAWVVQQR